MAMQKIKSFDDLGVELFIKEDEKLPISYFKRANWPLTVYLYFDCGAARDVKPGMSHFLEHLLVSGTEKYPTKELLAKVFADRGGIKNAFTGKVGLFLALYLTDGDDVEFSQDILNEFVFHSIFEPSVFEKEKTAILDEIRRSLSNFDRIVNNNVFAQLYPNSQISESVLGTIDSVTNITREELIEHYKTILLSSKRALLVAGDLPPEKVELIASKLKEKISLNGVADYKFIPAKKVDIKIQIDQKTSGVFVGYNALPITDKKYFALAQFLSWKLFSQSGLMIQKLRYDLGLTYGVSSSAMSSLFNGYSGGFVTCSKNNLELARDEMVKVYESTLFDSINKAEIDRFLNYIKKSRKRGLQTGDDWLDRFNYQLMHFGKDIFTFDMSDQLLIDTPIDELKELAQSIFTAENRSVILFEGN